jgi:hypothetical protein
MPLPIDGGVAHDAADAGKPVKIGGKASSGVPTAVAAADRVDAFFDLHGRLITSLYMTPQTRSGDVVGPKTVTLTTAVNAGLIAAPGAGNFLVITRIRVGNASATLTRLELVEGGTDGATDGTIVDSMPLAANGGGYTYAFDPPYKLPSNTAFKARLSAGVTDVRVNLMYYTSGA